jgi:peptide deformylase
MKNTMKILKYPNKTLTIPTVNWDFVGGNKSELIQIASNMQELLKTKPDGVALAANQAGYNIRMFVLDEKIANDFSLPQIIVNPFINPIESKLVEEQEGCLSFPGLFFPIKRHNNISCDYYDIDGNKRIVILEGFAARAFQHECEHLDGKLYIDNLPRRERFQVIGRIKNRGF